MAIDWWRSYHGAPTDPKWLAVAARAKVAPGVVSAVWFALEDHASQAEDRGSVADFDAESYAAFAGWPEDDVVRVVGALTDKGLITDGRLTAWARRQPKREDNSTERVRALREREKRSVTQRNAAKRTVTPDKNREEEITDMGPSEDEVLFELAWKAYPKRPNNPKAAALKAFMARVAEGVEARALVEAVDRYAAYCKHHRTEPRFVKMASTFFGPGGHWQDEYKIDTGHPDLPIAEIIECLRGEYAAWLGSADTKIHAFRGIEKDNPELWKRVGPAMEKLRFIPLFDHKARGDMRGLAQEIERQLSNGRS